MRKLDVFANVTLVTPRRYAARIFDRIAYGGGLARECVAGPQLAAHDAGLVYKVLGMETEPVKAMVREFWKLALREVAGAPIPEARPPSEH
jgi:urease accessory protein